ncbi:hypothetical protein FHW67_002391 [Herbaspirillum sp. Sphag1AN]|uniref:DUF7482 domain-containing protein n=1 Tax=unclassified Herbaspirillum TaxID=2624150 RepID=UPI00162264D7|nr:MULTISPECIES: hypothetical protein [unclassified Herbaspirillum]MBB3213102.1 hypothetical protein [Herbaspirillum sp. Sphag1AN]MBB3246299.1 hypothetical protein [Herbaspirillum sp. Sphag64]
MTTLLRFTAASLLCLSTTLAATLSASAQSTLPPGDTVELPLLSGWFEGKLVRYVTTDASDKQAAADMGANYVPRLANALNRQPQPGQPGSVERIYKILNFAQGSVLPSLPSPVGEDNANINYSPLWQVYAVSWNAGKQPHLLKSEEEVLAAEEAGDVQIDKTRIVVNCPVVFTAADGTLPNVKLHLANPGAAAK